MDEIRLNQIIVLKLSNGEKINGTVLDFENDRIIVLVDDVSIQTAYLVYDLDCLEVSVHTAYGLKKMKSHVISKLDGRGCIEIENNKAEEEPQKRENVRVVCNINFTLIQNNRKFNFITTNMSACALAFNGKGVKFQIGDEVEVIFSEETFSKEIKIKSEIIKAHDDFYVLKYKNLNMYDESKIVQSIFKLLSQR